MSQKIYVLSESVNPNICKIGIAKDPIRRMSQLQTGNYRKLQIHHIIQMPHGVRARTVESIVHNKLSSVKIDGGGEEWFKIGAENAFAIVQREAGITTPATTVEIIWEWVWWPADKVGAAIVAVYRFFARA